jgi:hypothetical protein
MHGWPFVLVAACLSFFALPARAEPEGEFEIRVDDCPSDLAERLPVVVRLEVRVLLRERQVSAPFVERISLRCDGTAVRIDAIAGAVRRGSLVDSRAIAPEHRARALGLAAAEIVDALWNETQGTSVSPAPAAPTMPPPVEPAKTAPEPNRASALAIGVGAVVERAGRPAALIGGGRVGAALEIDPVFTPVLSVDALFGEAATDPAAVGIRSVSAAAHVLVGRGAGSVRWGLGPGVRAGLVRLQGKPAPESGLDGQSVSAAFAGPALRARIACLLGSTRGVSPLVALEADAGLVVLPVRGMQDSSKRVFSLDGPWLTVGLSVGASL